MTTTVQQNTALETNSTILLNQALKEYDIQTENGNCIIVHVESVTVETTKAPEKTSLNKPKNMIQSITQRILKKQKASLVTLILSAFSPLTLPLCLVLVLGVGNVWGQTYYNMSSGNYSQNFNGITTLPTNFSAVAILSTGSIPIATKTTTASTSSLSVVGTGAAIGRDVATSTRLAFLTTGATNNTTAIATDLNLNFTSRNAGNLSFDVSTIFNSTGNRVGSLRVYYSIDGSTWSEITGTNLPYSATNNVAGSASVSITLPSAINNQATVKLRFYYHNGSGGSTGSRPRIGIDNLSVTSTAAPTAPTLTTPTVSSITTTSATLGATVSSNGGAALSARGTVWGTSASPTGNASAEGGTTVAAFSHSRTGLTANTLYTYRGYATNSVGTGYSADGTFTTLPLAPTVGSGNSITASGFTANWSHPTMGSASYTYTVEVDDDNLFGSINSTVSSISSSNTSQAITGLSASTTYYYRVKAVNTSSSVWSSTSAGVTTSSAATPTLNAVTLSSALTSTYGSASAGVSFAPNGSNLTAEDITATAQSGYEVSTTLGSGYGASVSVTGGTTVYVRFTSAMSAGDKNNATAVVLSGGGASSSANVTTSSSGNTVSQKALTVTGLTAQNKVYDGLTTATTTGTAALSGIVGADDVSLSGTPSFTFSSSIVASGVSVSTSGYSLTGAQSANYSLTQPTLSANITVRSLSITANNVSKIQGVLLSGGAGSTAFSSSGLQNSETIGSVTITYGTAGATTGDGNTVGVYASQVTPSAATNGTFTSSNYSISYVAGSITVTQAPCATEGFTNIGSSGTYGSKSWSGSGGTWNATDAREDQTITGKAMTIRIGNITSPSISGGIGDLTFKAKFPFSESSGNLNVKVNGNVIGTLNFSEMNGSTTITKTISNINIVGNITLSLESTVARYCIDDISWSCYSAPEINLKQSSTNLVSGSGSYSFGTETVGNTSSAVTFTIENTGTATLNLTGTPKVAISGHTSDFTIDQTSTSATVSASGSTTFTVTFSPTTTGARSATISIDNDDSNENPYTFTVTGTGATYAPSVTTSAATSISTIGATLNGEVTSDGGATVTERGFVYKTSSSVTISDNKTVVAGTTGTFSLSPSSLSASTQYYFRAYAINSVNTTLGSELNFWTLANAPTAPTVNTPTGSSLNVSIGGADGNSATTAYSIQETTSGNYVQANGSLAASAVWQTSSTWSSITVIGLSSATTYTFQVKARNGANTETAFGSTTSGTTSSIGLNAVILSSALTSTYGTASAGVSFTASGTNLTSNITATAQTGYQVSTDDLSYGSSVSVASGTTVYVRFTSTRLAGNYNNEIALVLSGGGASSNANLSTSLSGNTVSKATPTITTAPIATAITYGQTLASSTLSGGTASVAGAFAFTSPSTAPNAGTANQSVTFTPTDNTNYNTTTTNVSVSVNKANQTITFGALADKTTDDTPFALTATASSGLTVSYSSSNTAVATVAGSTVTIVGAGQTTITASQAGDANYNAATSVDQTLTVTIPACVTNSNQTGGWNFTTASPSTTIINLTIGDLTHGNNNGTTTLITSTSASSGYSGATGTNNAGAAARTGALTPGASGSAYFQFTLTPANGYNFTLTGISFGSRGTSTGPQAYSLRSSLDSYAADITTGSLLANSTWALKSNTGLSAVGQGNTNPVTFRIYGYNGSGGASANTANWRIDDLTLTVTVSNAPSSASVGSTQNLCGTLASTALGGNTPSLGTGTWTQTAGPGTTTFSNSNNGSSTATSSIEGAYTYKWSISNGCATVNEASVTVNYNSNPSAPSASAQSFCSASSPTVTNLSATGSNIQWYDASTNGNLLANATSLSSGNYYASQTVSGCESATRTSVAVTVNASGTWIGDSNDDWNIAGNWCGGVPNSSSAVVSVPTGVVLNLDTSPSVLNLTIGSGATINAGTYTITIADGGSITNNGTFNAQTGELVFNGAGTISGTSAMSINNLTLNGALTVNTSPTADGIVQLNSGASILNGSINYTVNAYLYYNQSGTVSSSSFEWPTNNGPNKVAIYNGTNLSLNENKSLNTNLSLANGRLILGDNHLTLGETATVTGTFSSANMIIATGLGELRKRFAQGSGDIASFTFPVGNSGGVSEYTPIVLDFASGSYGANAYVGVRVQDSKQATLNSSVTNYLNRNWIVEPNDITGFSYKIQLYYVDADFITDGTMAEGELKPIKISSGQWYQPTDGSFTNAVSQGSAGVFASANYLEWNGLSTFSEFGGAGGSNLPLPVELLSFTAECGQETILLKWQTASEFNSAYFEIQKSLDGITWNTIGNQTAAGNSTELLSYSFEDASKSANTSYYRLNQVDIDGLQKYYGPISPMCETINHLNGKTIPNPSNNEFWLQISSAEQQKITYVLQDINGTKILENTVELLPGSNMFPIRETIPAGMYFIILQTEKGQQQVIKHIRN
jgi:hypothetical protein